ncbi:MAG: Uma2 family endonuclease [Actinomycetota bacterium]|nr:Uma2 family endonuclease [Actinomycetota bacterium]
MAATARELMTAEEYFERVPTRHYSQLIDGEVVMDEPTVGHQVVAMRIQYALNDWTRAAPGRGEVFIPINVLMDEHNVFGPDISYLRETRVPTEDVHHIDGPPDLAIEVRSPTTWRYNVGKKMRSYERLGLPELWLVDSPVATVLVYRRSRPNVADFDVALELTRGESLTSPLLPGFALALDATFAPLRPS